MLYGIRKGGRSVRTVTYIQKQTMYEQMADCLEKAVHIWGRPFSMDQVDCRMIHQIWESLAYLISARIFSKLLVNRSVSLVRLAKCNSWLFVTSLLNPAMRASCSRAALHCFRILLCWTCSVSQWLVRVWLQYADSESWRTNYPGTSSLNMGSDSSPTPVSARYTRHSRCDVKTNAFKYALQKDADVML